MSPSSWADGSGRSRCRARFSVALGALAAAGLLACSTQVSRERVVRFWQGTPRAGAARDDHLSFIRTTLAPTTVLAGEGALLAYTFYIPSASPLPAEAELSELPFSEAAVLIYSSAEGLDCTRAVHPEYVPIHFLRDAFDPGKSCIATPQLRSASARGEPVRAARCDAAADRVAYELERGAEPPDWQRGSVLVSVVLRKRGVPEERFLEALAQQFDAFASTAAATPGPIDGHYARVGSGYVIHFVHVRDASDASQATQYLMAQHDRFMAGVAVPFELLASRRIAPFGAGWTAGVAPGAVVSVDLTPGATQCGR